MYEISKLFDFSASHQLAGLPDDHPCTRLHGHNYQVMLVLGSESLDPVGFVYDYRKLDGFKGWLDATFDHQHLNDQMPYNPTSEHLARFIYAEAVGRLGDLVVEVRVSETPKTWAVYRP